MVPQLYRHHNITPRQAVNRYLGYVGAGLDDLSRFLADPRADKAPSDAPFSICLHSFTPTKEPTLNSPRTQLRISAKELRELQELADKAGIPLSVAFRRGAKAYLLAVTDTSEMRVGRPPKKGGRLAA